MSYHIILILTHFSLLFVISPALHLAVMQGRLNNVRALLTESNIDAEAFNLRQVSVAVKHRSGETFRSLVQFTSLTD